MVENGWRLFDANATCPKCGHDNVSAQYHKTVSSPECPLWPNIRRHGEHLDRQCTRCRYTWAEAPLEVKQLS